MRCPGTEAPWGEGWGSWGQLHHLSLVLGESEVGLQPWCWAWTPSQPLSTSLPSRNKAVGADGVSRVSQSSALTSASCPQPHRPEPHFVSSHCCSTALEPALGLLSPFSCAGSCICPCSVHPPACVPHLLCAPLSCRSQQHPNKHLREEPAYMPVTSWSAPARPAVPPPWAASALDMCSWLRGAMGVLGSCAAPFHADPCYFLCEPSSAVVQQGGIVMAPGPASRGKGGPSTEGNSTMPGVTGGMDLGALRALHLPFPPKS